VRPSLSDCESCACRRWADLDNRDIHFNCEGHTCCIHFKNLHLAMRAAEVAARMIISRQSIMLAIGFEE
jgi:uncharacterized ferredoxin-like protein